MSDVIDLTASLDRLRRKARLSEADWLADAASVLKYDGILECNQFSEWLQESLQRLGPIEGVAPLFGVSPPTIWRWANGQSCPAPYARRAIIAKLSGLLEERAENLREQPAS